MLGKIVGVGIYQSKRKKGRIIPEVARPLPVAAMPCYSVKVQGVRCALRRRTCRGQPPSRARTHKNSRPPQGKEGCCLPRQGRKPQVFAPKERATGVWGAFATPQRALGTFVRSKVPPRAAVTEICIVRKEGISVASMVRRYARSCPYGMLAVRLLLICRTGGCLPEPRVTFDRAKVTKARRGPSP